jgi:hypothetical protein
MFFKILEEVSQVEIIATGRAIRELRRLRKRYRGRRWRKLKVMAKIELTDGTICLAELHWYEAHGVGPKEFIKEILEEL